MVATGMAGSRYRPFLPSRAYSGLETLGLPPSQERVGGILRPPRNKMLNARSTFPKKANCAMLLAKLVL